MNGLEVARVSLVDMKGRVIMDTQGAEDVEEVACCSRPLEAPYNVPNRECSGGNKSRIPANADYMGLLKPRRNVKDCMLYTLLCQDCSNPEDALYEEEESTREV
ncbi:hypothetical protein B9Z55_022878 [Caenorhabditis nigoni]|nr:hypothetical protein B9Z55_022878 [Caenorhabditis nigoni]